MRMVFLCGSLEPGCDGVGDYTRILAIDLIQQGHRISIIALNDRYVRDELAEVQSLENISITVLRLPSSWPAKKRFITANQWIDSFNPQWLSLQFVIYSYQSDGLPFGLGAQLARLTKGRQWHIMFHELWVGMPKESSIKHIILGKIQRQIIKSLINKIQPSVIHTQSKLYQCKLQKCAAITEYLPLFSNIPVFPHNDDNGMQDAKMPNLYETISFVTFGSIHPRAPIENFIHEALSYSQNQNKQLTLTILGRSGSQQEHWIKVWESAGFTVKIIGEQSPEKISSVLSNATFGISTCTLPFIEKSGSVAAMRIHGLPVICIAQPLSMKELSDFSLPIGVLEYVPGKLYELLQSKKTFARGIAVRNISNQFLSSILNFK